MVFKTALAQLEHVLQQPSKIQWLIGGVFFVVIILEYSTPPPFVFGYLYIGAILLANSRLRRTTAIQVTGLAILLTGLNLVVPGVEPITSSTLANRLIAVIALVVTAWLSNRNRQFEEAIANQQIKLQAQEQLNQVREDFASTLTHDLKTPLLGAIETLQAFEQEKFGPVTGAQRRVLAIMTRSHRTTLQMVETLLDVYRNDTEGLKLQRQPMNLVALAEEAIATLTELAFNRQVFIQLNYGASDFRPSLWVCGDAFQLQRVFINLLSNGINHSRRGGKVQVVLTSHDTHHVVKVLDQGQGILESELPFLFERFYQGHCDRQTKGTGLGLYLTRQIVEAHGGTIWAENHQPHGALFGFRLPALVSAPNSGC